MKKVNFFFAATLTAALILTGCAKQPEASFSTDKQEYDAGETVKITNSSLDATRYNWTWDGGTSTDQAPSIKLTEKTEPGNITIKMTAYSKNDKKTSEATKTIKVKEWSARFVGSWTSTGCNPMTITSSGAKSLKASVDGFDITVNLTDALNGNMVPFTFYDEFYEDDLEVSGTIKISLDGKTITTTTVVKDSWGDVVDNTTCTYKK